MPGRVLRIITRLNRGGPLRQLAALVPHLEGHGWNGPLIAGRTEAHEPDGGADLLDVGVDLVRMRALRRGIDPSADARAFRRLMAAMRHHQPALVHTHMGKAGALGRLAAGAVGIPAVHTYHGHHLESALVQAGLSRVAERLLGRFTRAAICLSPRQRRDVVDVHRILPAERVFVIEPGIDLERLRARACGAPHAPPRWRRGDGNPLFLWAGRFVPVKAPQLLVEAVALSKRPFQVVMLGAGPLLRSVRATVAAHGLTDRILCPGPVAEVGPWIAAADGLVLCSRSEGAPVSVVEAMALGRPVVVTTVGGNPDMVTHEGTGLWVAPNDALALSAALDRLAADASLRNRLGRAARVEADRRFGAERLARETATLYERVTSEA